MFMSTMQQCPHCGQFFTSNGHYARHLETKHRAQLYPNAPRPLLTSTHTQSLRQLAPAPTMANDHIVVHGEGSSVLLTARKIIDFVGYLKRIGGSEDEDVVDENVDEDVDEDVDEGEMELSDRDLIDGVWELRNIIQEGICSQMKVLSTGSPQSPFGSAGVCRYANAVVVVAVLSLVES